MNSWVIFTVLAASSMCFSQGEGAPCAEICYTTELTGFGPGGVGGCSCSGSKATRAGPGGCSCGQCYDEANGAIIGYAANSDGTCTFGTDCGACTRTPDSPSSKSTTSPSSTTPTPTTTTTPPTSTSTSTMSPSSTTTTTDTSSNPTTPPSSSNTDQSKFAPTTNTSNSSGSVNNNAGEIAGSSAPKTVDNGMKTWQIALIICCAVLLFTVAVVSVLSCYCKARNRLNENEDNLADASYYQQQHARQYSDVTGSGVPTPTLFPRNTYSHQRSGSSGSLNNEMKPMYANSANSDSSDRLGMGLAPVHMRTSSGDLVGMGGSSYSNGGSYSNERILSGSYPIDRRSSNRSQGRQLEPRYSSTHDRESVAVEL